MGNPSAHRSSRGFTLIEVMIVIMIIGVLATVAINLTIRLQEKAHVDALKSDLSSAYKAALAFHSDDADGVVTLAALKQYGYRVTKGVQLKVIDGTESHLLLRASHFRVGETYRIDSRGTIGQP